jgi:hypothetical protein
MTSNMKETIPAAIPVEELAAQMEITPNNLLLAIELAAAAGYTVNLGLGIHVKVEILDEADHCDDAMIELVRLRLAGRMRRRIVPAEWPASGRIR